METVSLVVDVPSLTSTVKAKLIADSKSIAAALATVMLPELSIANAPPVLPPVIANVVATSPVVTTVPTGVLLGSSSPTLKFWPGVIVAATSLTLMVSVSLYVLLAESVTWTVTL